MLQFFSSIAEFFDSIWMMITNIFSSLLTMIDVIANVTSLPAFLLGFVPGFLGSCILCVFAIGIIKLLIGWGNS